MASPPLIPSRWREAVEWAVQQVLTLRPRFYNGITWTLVVSGTLLMASPLWEQIIAAILERGFDLRITGSGNDTAWGLALVACGLLYQLTMHGMTQRHEARLHARADANHARNFEHDRTHFAKLQNTVSERALLELLHFLDCNHSTRNDELSPLTEMIDFLAQPNNQFLEPAIRQQANELLQALLKLRSFVAYHFFPLRGQPIADGLYLHPDLNIDRGGSGDPEHMARYDHFADELHELINTATKQYSDFRETIKQTLAV